MRRDPRLRLRLEATDDEPAHLLLEVGVAVGVTQDRQVRVHAVERLGDHVEVLRRVQGHGDADPGGDLLGPLPGTVDDDLRLHVAGIGADAGDATASARVLGEHVGDPHALDHAGTALPGALGERAGEVGGVGLPVTGEPDGADEVVDLHQRVALLRLGRAQQGAVEVEGLGRRRRAPQLGHPVLGARHDEAAALLVAGREPGLLLQLGVEPGRVLHQAGAALGGAQHPHEAGRVPRRPRRELPLLEQQHVAPPQPREVVGDAGADHPAADHDDLGALGEARAHRGSSPDAGPRWSGSSGSSSWSGWSWSCSSSWSRSGPVNPATAPS